MTFSVVRVEFPRPVPDVEVCDLNDHRLPDEVDDLVFRLGIVGLKNPAILDVLEALGAAAGTLPGVAKALPELLTSQDVADALRIKTSSAQRLVRQGKLGAWSQPGKRFLIRREVFLEHLRSIESMPESARRTTAKQRYIDMLKN